MVVNDDRGIYRNIRDGLLSNAGIADKTTVPIGLKIDYKIDGVDYISPQSIGIKVLDFGTSEFWEDHSDFRDREISVLIETFQRIFTHEHGLEILQMNDLESPLLILHALRGLSDVYFLAHMFQQYGAEPGGSGHFPNVSVMNNDQLGILRRFASLIWRYPIFDIDKSIDFFIEVCGIDHKDSLRSEVGFCVAFNDFFGLELENIDLNLWFDGGWDRTCLLYAARRKQYIEQNDPYS